MTPKYKLLALDIDGTLLTSRRTVTYRTRHWIKKAREAGVIVMFATGRGYERTRDLWHELCPDSPIVMANGAEIWLGPDKLLERHFIENSDVAQLHELATSAGGSFWGYTPDSFINWRTWQPDDLGKCWVKFGIRHDDPKQLSYIRETASAWPTITVTRSRPTNLEFSAKGISKKYGIEKVCEHLAIDVQDVMAVGDSPNDLKLIHSVGLGVAMGNAEEIVKQAAHVVTSTNNQDGVAKAIRTHLLA